MADASELLDELQIELEETGRSLGELLQEALEDPSSAPDVVAELMQEAQESGQSLGELFQDASQDTLEQFGGEDLFMVDDELFLDLEDGQLPLDPTDEDFLRQLDVFGVGESFGLIPSDKE
ncbi:MAG: hypothetical protein ACI8UR_000826 [Natronomonas sp.]|jgi:hypothetical protein|uniref:hypothetical protein n=1 Tax=Natronomonas sp. TaxID=2184060 RepID=UPI0039891DE9